ncbi:MAG: hypothetical protein KGY43_03145, partial [Halodesulfurarchaeum sp.]|nr:hypothetical protein [Halodesulfurarchaeum sp.]
MTEEQVVQVDGVQVSKSFDAEGFPVPAVTLSIKSNRDEPVALELTESVPEQFDIDQIGFHPDYGSDDWNARSDGTLRFEREIDPGESMTTVYGIRMDDRTDPSPLLDEPAIEVEPATGESASERQAATKSDLTGDSATPDSNTGLTPEGHELPNDDAEIIGGSNPNEAESSESESAMQSMPSETPTDEGVDTAGNGINGDDSQEGSETTERTETQERTSEDLYSTSPDEGSSGRREETASDTSDSEPTVAEVAAQKTDSQSDSVPRTDNHSSESEDPAAEASLVDQLIDEIDSGTVSEEKQATLADALMETTKTEQVQFDHLQSRVS